MFCTRKCLAAATLLMFALLSGCQDTPEQAPAITTDAPTRAEPKTFAELIELSDDELEQIDIARINLLCAENLPGADGMDVSECLQTLDHWAKIVKEQESRYYQQFLQNPAQYDNSVAKFKAVNLALTLKQDLGCGYNLELVNSGAMANVNSTHFFRNSQDLFLHGFMSKDTAGSCASLPVLMVAVGRRCGYPMHLVTTKGHLFCRWDDGNERFNLETAIQGVDSQPDEYYLRWPFRVTQQEVEAEGYLNNQSASEALGVFAQIRAMCLQENNQIDAAVQAYEVNINEFPNSKLAKVYLSNIQSRQ